MSGSASMIGQETRAPGVVVGGFDRFGNEIRQFNDSGIQSQIDQALSTLSPGDRGAVIAVVDKKSGEDGTVKLATVFRPLGSDRFSVIGFLGHDLGRPIGEWDASAAVRIKF